jgi:hypothetical protein
MYLMGCLYLIVKYIFLKFFFFAESGKLNKKTVGRNLMMKY